MTDSVWYPNPSKPCQMQAFIDWINQQYQLSITDYHALHQWSIDNPALFWPSIASFFNLQFDTPPTTILKTSADFINTEWFVGAQLNAAKHLLSGDPDNIALVSITESGNRTTWTYKELTTAVSHCVQGLRQAGVTKGDRVAGVLPNIAPTIIAMLATSAIGAIWSSCSPDFGETAIIDRLGQIEPKVLFICDGHQYQGKQHSAKEKINAVLNAIPALSKVVIYPFLKLTQESHNDNRIQYWNDFLDNKATSLTFESLPFNHPWYILFSSGTTGKPKCIIHSVGGTLLQHIKELGLHTNLTSDDNLCFYTTCGWMMWNWMVSTLALKATLTLYEGSPNFPDFYRLFHLIEEEKITVFGTSAKFISSCEKEGIKPNEKLRLATLKTILSTGSPLLPRHYDFVYQSIKSDVQISSISGGTDIISCFALGNPLLPVYRGELQCLGLGMAVEVYNEQGQPVQDSLGELVCTKPFPSMPVGFWQDIDKKAYHKAYFERFPNVWAHGDFAQLTHHQGLIIVGRSDATLNPGGIRIGTAEIYRVIESLPAIQDSIVISQDWHDDVRIVLFVKLQEGNQLSDELIHTIKQIIRQKTSPRHIPAKILQVTDIPRTLSGKLVELAVRQTVHGQAITNLSSLANPEALAQYKDRSELATE